MSMTIGPIGVTAASDAQREPERLTVEGDRLTINGTTTGTSVNERKAFRDQLRGLVEPGQPTIYPVTSSTDPTLDGFYRVLGVRADFEAIGYVARGWNEYQIELERLPGGNALPGIESIIMGGFRPNGVSISNTAHAVNSTSGVSTYLQAEWAIPSLAVELDNIGANQTATANDVYKVRGFAGGYQTDAVRWAVSAANFYGGACRIEQKIDSRWMTAVGRQAVITDTSKIRISNGYMGVTFEHPSNATEMGIRFAGFGRTAGVNDWTQQGTFIRLGPNAYSNAAQVNSVTVIRNDPEEVRVRLSGVQSALKTFFTVDISLRRGLDYVTAVFPAGTYGGVPAVKLDATANLACTSTAEGIYRTATTGSIQPWVLCNESTTKDTTIGYIQRTGSTTATAFGIGPVFDTARPSSYTGTMLRWFAPFTERQRFVGR